MSVNTTAQTPLRKLTTRIVETIGQDLHERCRTASNPRSRITVTAGSDEC
jgi:hypothetical protein